MVTFTGLSRQPRGFGPTRKYLIHLVRDFLGLGRKVLKIVVVATDVELDLTIYLTTRD